MAEFLLDMNVFLSLAWPNHAFHRSAQDWFSTLGNDQWATCPMTECSFVRISSNPSFTAEALTVGNAFKLLDSMVSHPSHVFWEDSITLGVNDFPARPVLRGHKQITDAYLFCLSIRRGARLVTFDDGILSLAQNDAERAAILLLRLNSVA